MFKKRSETIARKTDETKEEEEDEEDGYYQTTAAELIEEAFMLQSITKVLDELDHTMRDFAGLESQGWGSVLLIQADDDEEEGNLLSKGKIPGGIIRLPNESDMILQDRYLEFLEA